MWIEQALAAEPDAEREAARVDGPLHADVCIVGGGFTGLWTAIRLLDLEPSLQVVVLEADLCGTGASGRNGGIMSDWWMELETLVRHVGPEDARRLATLVAGAADEIERLCVAEGFDAHVAREGWLWTATTPAQVRSLRAALEATRDAGVERYEELRADELEARLGSGRHLLGLFDPRGGSVQPALLARGLRRAALRRGAKVLEHSPVTSLEAGARVQVECAGGVVSAERVVLAANAWQAHLPDLHRDTVVVSSDLVATAPAPQAFEELGWTGSEVSFDAKTMLHYWRTTRDRRLVFGSGGAKLALGARVGMGFEQPSDGHRVALEGALRGAIPAFASAAVTHAWTGAIDRTSSGLPRIGDLGGDPRITYVTGFSGTGVLPCVTIGRCLASVVLNRDDEPAEIARLLRRSGPRLPPEPVRYIGGRAVQRAISSKERAEELGRKPAAVATAVAKLLPSGPTRPSR